MQPTVPQVSNHLAGRLVPSPDVEPASAGTRRVGLPPPSQLSLNCPPGLKLVPGSVTAAEGFQAGGVFADIKGLGTGKGSNKGQKLDLGMIVSDVPARVAGLFTTNQVCAAPVKFCIPRVRAGKAQAIVVNSGNANACTGQQGLRDAATMAASTARHLGLQEGLVLVGSTGRIGVPLPMPHLRRGIAELTQHLGRGADHDARIAEAVMTSDTRRKEIAVEFTLGRRAVRIGGVCKGAGMIQPGMSSDGRPPAARALHATMLAFLTTDAAVAGPVLRSMLNEAVARSFNRITVDGDMSTNDTVLILANGRAGNRPVQAAGADRRRFQAALNYVTLELAKMIVRDGEGVSRFVTVQVTGARSAAEADAAARAVGNSSLVRTSWCGGDPNWGRILDALGYSAARVVEEKVDLSYSRPGQTKRWPALRRGQPAATPFGELCKVVAGREFELHIDLHLGKGSALLYASDLTEAYVDFNKGDVSDPASLGG